MPPACAKRNAWVPGPKPFGVVLLFQVVPTTTLPSADVPRAAGVLVSCPAVRIGIGVMEVSLARKRTVRFWPVGRNWAKP